MSLEPPLSAGELAQPALGGLASSALENGAAAGVPGPRRLDGFSSVGMAVAVGGEVDDAEIDAEPVFGSERLGLGYVAGADQEPLAADQRQVGLALAEGQE